MPLALKVQWTISGIASRNKVAQTPHGMPLGTKGSQISPVMPLPQSCRRRSHGLPLAPKVSHTLAGIAASHKGVASPFRDSF
ncbi:hypothetical protein DPMN_127270 [Dreissena polymorpha]|uniref:Uncharacterized protein n=1 Tax=Dreissena polymorpha TaxID=45954 RepID=A0A9D4JUP7_DREPO|nr:hypothetical protein DPMN_127270 [Dreissena polymorpha]